MLQLSQFCAHQKSVPEALKYVVNQSPSAIQKSELKNISIQEEQRSGDFKWKPVVDRLLEKALEFRLLCGRLAGERNLRVE